MAQGFTLKRKCQVSRSWLHATCLCQLITCVYRLAHVSLVYMPATVTKSYARRTVDLGLNSGHQPLLCDLV